MYGFPATYQPVQNVQQYNQPNMPQYPAYNNNQIPQPQTTQQVQQAPAFQFGGLFRVQSIEDVYRWEIHQGEIIIFITNDGQFMLTKELGFSPMDRPIVKKFRAFDEQQEAVSTSNAPAPATMPDMSGFAHKSEIEDLKLEIDVLKEQLANMRGANNEK